MSDCFDHMADAYDEYFSRERDDEYSEYDSPYTRKKAFQPKKYRRLRKPKVRTVQEQLTAPEWGKEVSDDDIEESLDFLNSFGKPKTKGFKVLSDDKSDAPF